MTIKMTYTSELIKNYKQAEIMSPEGKFEALQTSVGDSLLFSLGTDGAFYVTQELSNDRFGWVKRNLSSAQIAKDFSGQTGITCKDFSVAQNRFNGTIGTAMVIAGMQNDHLYLCLQNSNSDPSWLSNPQWVNYPFDDPNNKVSTVKICNVMISETIDGQYIVVDILRDPTQPNELISRYYLNTNSQTNNGQVWQPHDVSMDIQAGDLCCLGRNKMHTSFVDGLYTCGQVDGSTQFQYQPLYNAFNPALPANPVKLNLPGNLAPEAIAACRNSDNSTDLYVTAQGGLYYFASTNQQDNSQATLLMQNSQFNGVRKLFVDSYNSNIVVWGLNGEDAIFYTSCPRSQITAQPSAWSTPMSILTNAEQVSPYLNIADGGNTFFAHTGDNQLTKAIKSPATTLWKFQQITLPPPDLKSPAQKFSSYTTRIQLTDENNLPLANTGISLSAVHRANVYINDLYYVLNTTPISVQTDELGSITIVEWVTNLNGTRLIITGEDGTVININPMDKPFQKVATLNTSQKLQAATIQNYDGTSKPLVAPGQSGTDAAASGISQLSSAYAKVSSATSSSSAASSNSEPSGAVVSGNGGAMASATALSSASPLGDFADAIIVDAGDLFNMLSSAAESFIQIVEDTVNDIWNFIAKIGDAVYSCVLDCVEKVIGAVEWIFKAILTAIEDLIKFLEFLFEWEDIARAKKVIYNLAKVLINYQVDEIKTIQGKFDGLIANLEQYIDQWSGLDWTGLGSAASAPMSNGSNPTQGMSASSMMVAHHYKNNAANIMPLSSITDNPTNNPIDAFIQALSNEATVLSNVIDQLIDLAKEFTSISLTEALKKFVGIIALGALSSTQVVIDALFDVLIAATSAILDILSAPIYIPVISDILSDFGVPSLSMLDLFCWITAIPFTIIYKIAEDEAPFPDNATTTALINATDYTTFLSLLSSSQSSSQQSSNVVAGQAAPAVSEAMLIMAATSSTATSDQAQGSTDTQTVDPVALHFYKVFNGISGLACILGAMASTEDILGNRPPFAPSFSKYVAPVWAIISGVTNGVANLIIPLYPLEGDWRVVDIFTLVLRVSSLVTFSDFAQSRIVNLPVISNLKVTDPKKFSAVVDAILVIPALACSIKHFVDLSSKPNGSAKTWAILEESSNCTAYVGRIAFCLGVCSSDPRTKTVAAVVFVGANVITGGIQLSEIGYSA